MRATSNILCSKGAEEIASSLAIKISSGEITAEIGDLKALIASEVENFIGDLDCTLDDAERMVSLVRSMHSAKIRRALLVEKTNNEGGAIAA